MLEPTLRLRHFACILFSFVLVVSGGCGGKKEDGAETKSGGKALIKVRLQTDWFAQPEHGGFYQALIKGYYKDAGLDVEILQGGPNLYTIPIVASGQADFGMERSDSIIVAESRGIPVVMLGATMQGDPQAFMFHMENEIKDFKDLDGKTVMIVPGSYFLPILEKTYGIKINQIPSDFGMSRFLADINFIQQCYITNEPYYVAKQGAHVGTLLLSKTGFAPYRIWFTRRELIEKHPEMVRAFTEASIKGWKEYLSDPKEANARIASMNPKMTPDFMEYSLKALMDYKLISGDPAKGEEAGQIRVDRIQTQIAQLADLKMLSRAVKVEEAFDGRFQSKH